MVNEIFAVSHGNICNFVGDLLSILPGPTVIGKGVRVDTPLLSGLLALHALCPSNKGTGRMPWGSTCRPFRPWSPMAQSTVALLV